MPLQPATPVVASNNKYQTGAMMGLIGYRKLMLAGCTAIFSVLAIPAHAQIALPEITIFGEKVDRPSIDVTTSVGVITSERIQQEQIFDFHDALNAAANTLSTRASSNNGGITIRGVNSEGLSGNQNAGAAPVIAVVVDGALQNAEAVRRGLRSVWDVEQVEVLRGPQSTLQGRNATAGAVFIKTKDPTFNYEAMMELTAGSHSLFTTGFMWSGPILPNELAFRVAGQLYRSNNDIDYVDPANNVLGQDRFGNIRGKLLWTPSSLPGFRALFTVAHTNDKPSVNTVSGPDYFARIYDTPSTLLDYRSIKTNNYISDLSYSFGLNYKLRSITSFAATDTTINSAPGNAFYLRDDLRKGGDFTQDFRLEIDNNGNGLSGVLGLFYGKFTTKLDSRIEIDPALLGGPPLGLIPYQNLVSDYETKSLAAYADLRYRIDRWVVIAGGRALRDEVVSTATGAQLDPIGFTYVPINTTTDDTFNAFLPKAGLTYDLTPKQTIGFTYSPGYRAGFSDVFIFTPGARYNVLPERLHAYEISYRSQWLNDRLAFNANFFYYDYKNQQFAYEPGPLPGLAVITNANRSHAYGAEFETRFKATDRITVYSSLGLLFTRFDDFTVPAIGGVYTGNQFPEAPSFTLNLGGLYKDPNGFFTGANVRFIDGYYSNTDVANSPLRYVGSATILDARLGWEFANKSTFTLFAKNLLNERYLTYLSTGGTNAGVGDSRQFGVSWALRY